MGIVNKNIRLLRVHVFKETKAEFANRLEIPEGRFVPYEQEANPKQDFYIVLNDKLGIDLHRFLTIEYDQESIKDVIVDNSSQDKVKIQKPINAEVLSMIKDIANSEDPKEREIIAQTLSKKFMETIDERDSLKNELLDSYRNSVRSE